MEDLAFAAKIGHKRMTEADIKDFVLSARHLGNDHIQTLLNIIKVHFRYPSSYNRRVWPDPVVVEARAWAKAAVKSAREGWGEDEDGAARAAAAAAGQGGGPP